ncbi:MAG: ABC-F family ATP-binding cassette domain-containing protein, partial [Gammaproteobacteria bacterium]|nr:ABC-F family ATP-binding cassette domain-containing protein [Gammaproteobacteria bacterium]
MLLRLSGVSLAFGSRPLLDQVELLVGEGERVCVVGRNGEGKSSLLKLVASNGVADDGDVWVKPTARVAWLEQDHDVFDDCSVFEVVRAGVPPDLDSWDINHRVETVCSKLGLAIDARVATLS